MLRYAGANQTALPPGQPPNVGTIQPWSLEIINSVSEPPELYIIITPPRIFQPPGKGLKHLSEGFRFYD